jgi:gamma-glutamylcyclotransferase (GGCT)/AIG2-like uncharacterized protein YtfP
MQAQRLSYLFVYGTLRRGSNNKFARLLQTQAQWIGNARMPGRLYQFGSYPGAVISNDPNEWVRGELYNLRDPARLLSQLDEYEGGDYQRTIAKVQPNVGECIQAWVYVDRGRLDGILIPSGEWPA